MGCIMIKRPRREARLHTNRPGPHCTNTRIATTRQRLGASARATTRTCSDEALGPQQPGFRLLSCSSASARRGQPTSTPCSRCRRRARRGGSCPRTSGPTQPTPDGHERRHRRRRLSRLLFLATLLSRSKRDLGWFFGPLCLARFGHLGGGMA